jgi:hypothetical protein
VEQLPYKKGSGCWIVHLRHHVPHHAILNLSVTGWVSTRSTM